MIDRIALGRAAEAAAESFLQQRGLRTLQRNFHCRMGEIDLVMRDGDYLVFTEVRFRRAGQHGSGADSITQAKRRKLVLTAGYYLRSRKVSSHQSCRFDVISVSELASKPASELANTERSQYDINWIRNAFQADS